MIRALLFVAIVLPAAAQQAQAPKPPAEPKKEPEHRSLDLRLDNPSSFATTAPLEKEPAKGLPTLGGDARKFEPPAKAGTRTEGGPYPKDTAPNY